MTVIFNDAGHALVAGEIRVFHYVKTTGEYCGWSNEYIPVGVSLPGSSTLIDPGDEMEGHVWVFNDTAWVMFEDHRGEEVYSVENGSVLKVGYIGAIHDGYTRLVPSSPHDIWTGNDWMTDRDAVRAADIAEAVQKKNSLRTTADSEIAWLSDAVDAGIAIDGEKTSLAAWKKYRVLLMRVDTAAPVWPTVPVKQAS